MIVSGIHRSADNFAGSLDREADDFAAQFLAGTVDLLLDACDLLLINLLGASACLFFNLVCYLFGVLGCTINDLLSLAACIGDNMFCSGRGSCQILPGNC